MESEVAGPSTTEIVHRLREWHTEPAPAGLTIIGFPDRAARETRHAIHIPWLLGLIATRNWMRVKLALFTLPLCLPALVIYSGLGMHLYACYHMVAAAILLALPVEALLRWHSRRRKNSSRYYE